MCHTYGQTRKKAADKHVRILHANKTEAVIHLKEINEKTLRETQTLRIGCSKVEPKLFSPLQTPFPGAQDGQNLISWRSSLPSPTEPVW